MLSSAAPCSREPIKVMLQIKKQWEHAMGRRQQIDPAMPFRDRSGDD
jgi:hypothetical protein